ncbi:hypothetical protein HPB50_001804 [Hyalomma asiaticum]|uniref:Uncharacterized protein n=1 Tax=Hyalomma asiaticum TaxID=266040 RepID=A0ACB7TAV3_HYAAI|nr:hypothetical protein HPB50_001804 [Hyalomma asiaticum]
MGGALISLRHARISPHLRVLSRRADAKEASGAARASKGGFPGTEQLTPLSRRPEPAGRGGGRAGKRRPWWPGSPLGQTSANARGHGRSVLGDAPSLPALRLCRGSWSAVCALP